MRIARKVVALLTLAVLFCTLTAGAVFAAEDGKLWAVVEQKDGTTVKIVADTVVTDGVIKVSYDSSVLTYQSTQINEACVAMHAVNGKEAGTVLISWVAPGGYKLEGDAVCLLTLHFEGADAGSITVTGTAHGEDGSKLTFADAPDTSRLAAAIADAEALEESKYTEESYANLEKALDAAKTVLSDGTATQDEVDAALRALRDAMNDLVEKAADPTEESKDPTEESKDPTEESKDPTESTATKPTEDNGSNSETGDDSNVWLFAAIGLISVAAIAVLTIKMIPKKGGNAK